MKLHSGVAHTAVLAFSAVLLLPLQPLAQGANKKKPSLSLKATPAMSFAPARIVLLAELKGGANDHEDYYCPNVEWEWGDDTSSTSDTDCEPYAEGKSQIKRRYTVEHRYKNQGTFRVRLLLKKGTKVIASANTVVNVRQGLGPPEGR